MKKRIISTIIIFMILLQPLSIIALDYPDINSKIIEVYDLNNKEVVYEIDSQKRASIASLTKIATTITAIETIPNLDEEVTITWNLLNTVRWDLSKAGLKAGDRVTYRDLLYASMLPSGADATNSIAILSSGSIDNFVAKMNDFVKRIGLENTHFVNVTGLDDENHYSTADDVRKLLEYALSNELFRKIYTTREYTLRSGLKVQSTIVKYNPTSIDTSQILGSKSGYTGDAGYCLSSLSNINSHDFIVITLNAEHKNNQFYSVVDSVNMIHFLMEHFKNQVLIHKGDVVQTIPFKYSKIDSYEMKALEDIILYLPDDYDKDKIKIEYNGLDHLSFLNKKEEEIGTISYYYDGELLQEDKIILHKDLKISFEKIFHDYYYLIIGIPLFIIGIIVLIILMKD